MNDQDFSERETALSGSLPTNIRNPELVREKHLLIARKAAKLFITKGYDKTTMREIAKSANMAVGSLYDYISKKEDVLCLVFDIFHQHVEDYDSFFDGDYRTMDPKESLRNMLQSGLRNNRFFRNEIRLIYRETNRLPEAFRAKILQRELDRVRDVERFLKWGMEQGAYKIADPFLAASMIFFQLTIGPLRGWSFEEKYTASKLDELIVDSIMESII